MKPLASVVIPCYAQAHFLGDAIASVLAQTYRSSEIIVIDDGSPDDVPAVVKQFPGVRYYRTENRGLCAARNQGLAECRGEFVVFLDADDRLLPNALAAGVAALAGHPQCALVWGRCHRIDARGDSLAPGPPTVEGPGSYLLLLRSNIVGPPLVVMFRRSVVVDAGGFSLRHRFGEDYELFLRIARTREIWCHSELIAQYRMHSTNISRDSRGLLEGMLLALEEQRVWVRGDAELRRALRAGRRNARELFDADPRMDALRDHVRARRWAQTIAASAVLLCRYPRLFLPMLARRLKKPAIRPAT